MSGDIGKLAFDSVFRYGYIAAKGSISISIGTVFPATIPTYTIAHNLGYKPFVKSWYSFSDGKVFDLFAGPASYNIDGNAIQVDNSYVDTTNFYVTFFGLTNPGTVTGKLYYRIYAEPQQ